MKVSNDRREPSENQQGVCGSFNDGVENALGFSDNNSTGSGYYPEASGSPANAQPARDPVSDRILKQQLAVRLPLALLSVVIALSGVGMAKSTISAGGFAAVCGLFFAAAFIVLSAKWITEFILMLRRARSGGGLAKTKTERIFGIITLSLFLLLFALYFVFYFAAAGDGSLNKPS